MRYPAHFKAADEGGFVVTFRDIPEAITQGETEAEAMEMAADALLTAMEFYFEDKRQVPTPSDALDGEVMVPLPASVWAKVLLLNEMLKQKVTASDLARRMGKTPQDIQRLTNLAHATKIDTIAEAIEKLGRRLDVAIA